MSSVHGVAVAAPSPTSAPSVSSLVALPALVTLAINLARLHGERNGWPAWLASTKAGGGGALLGISWLPPLLGAWWATRIAGTTDRPKRLLAIALLAYGYLARLPVFVITWIAESRQWDTHFTKYGPGAPETYPKSFAGRMGATAMAQLGFWPLVWTLGTGMLVGWLVLRARAKRAA